jgi:ketosteroid isomerase-like protein
MDEIAIVQEYFAAWRRGDAGRLTSLLDNEVSAGGPLATRSRRE